LGGKIIQRKEKSDCGRKNQTGLDNQPGERKSEIVKVKVIIGKEKIILGNKSQNGKQKVGL
jgi:hypothetical protein